MIRWSGGVYFVRIVMYTFDFDNCLNVQCINVEDSISRHEYVTDEIHDSIFFPTVSYFVLVTSPKKSFLSNLMKSISVHSFATPTSATILL